jgi:replicative DNA helicase
LEIQFEKLLLTAFIKDEKFLKETMGYVEEDNFDNQYFRYFYLIIETYYRKYRKRIPFDIFKYMLQNTVAKQNFEKEELPIVSSLVVDLFNSSYDVNFIRQELGNQIKKNRLRQILNQHSENVDINNIEKLLEQIGHVNSYDPNEDKPLEYTSSLHKRSLRQSPIPTGLNTLDTHINGGISPGEFGIVAAQTNGCKSMMLLNFAWGAVMDNKKVLFITLEDSQDTVMMRFDALFSHQEFMLFRRDPSRSAALKKKVAKHKGLLYVKDYSSGVCTPAKIRGLLAGMDGLGLVIVDYLDELGSGDGKRKDRWQEVEDASRQLKAVAHDLKIPVWTATQTSASSYGKEFTGLQDIYGGKGKAHIAHIVLTIVQTDDERKADRLRILVSKQKSGPKGAVIDCLVNLAKCRIYDAKTSPV